jgi:hypothetical protein
LLPSKEIRALCAKVPFAATRGDDAAYKTLREELGIDSEGPYVTVYDGKGELLGARSAGVQGCTRANAARYPALLAETIEEILARPVSFQELERQWKSGAKDEKLVETLMERLMEMYAFKKLVNVSTAVIDDRNRSARLRDLGRINRYVGHSLAMGYTAKDARQLALEGERIIPDMRDPALIERLLGIVWEAYAQEFDFPAKAEAAVKRMEEQAAGRPDVDDSRKAIHSFSSYIRKQASLKEEQFRKLPDGWDHNEVFTRGQLSVQLGKAKETIEYLSMDDDKGPPFDGWLREAREKLERESRK